MENVFQFSFQGSAAQYLKEYWGLELSNMKVMQCPLCWGRGEYEQMDGGADYTVIPCGGCKSSGKIMVNSF